MPLGHKRVSAFPGGGGAGQRRSWNPRGDIVTDESNAHDTQPLAAIGAFDSGTGLVPRLGHCGTLYASVRSGSYSKKFFKQDLISTRWRWQSLSNTPTTVGSLQIHAPGDTVGTFATPFAGQDMPMYAFNLTTLPYGTIYKNDGTSAGANYQYPMFRMKKISFANTVPSVQNYKWQLVGGNYNAAEGINVPIPANRLGAWNFLEKNDMNSSVSPIVTGYVHNYSKATIMMFAPTTRPCRFEIKLVKFRQGFGPQRCYGLAGGTLAAALLNEHDSPLNQDHQTEHDAFYDYHFSKRLGPYMHVGTPSPNHRVWTVLKSKIVDLHQTNTVDVNTNPMRCVLDVLYKDGGWFNTEMEENFADQKNRNFVSEMPFETLDANQTRRYAFSNMGMTSTSTYSSIYPDMKEDVYLVITAISEDLVSASGTFTNTLHPTFDILVESKYTIPAA